MSAITAFAHFPDLMRIRSDFEWLKVNDRTSEVVDRKDIIREWNEIAPRVNNLKLAYTNPDTDEAFPPNPGFLCRRYCPVRTCPFHGE